MNKPFPSEYAVTLFVEPYLFLRPFWQPNFIPPRNESVMWNAFFRETCALSGGFPGDI